MTHDDHRLLADEVALVTGAGRGIGRAIAETFARAGASVALVARSPRELAEAASAVAATGAAAVAHSADVTNEAAMCDVVEQVRSSLGPISILVNNAGSIGPIGPFGGGTINDWWRCVEVNLRGTIVCSHLVMHEMAARGHGRILNIVSGAGAASLTYFTAYVTSKTAVVRWTEAVAAELAPYGVRMFAMEPGTTATAMSGYSLTSQAGRRWIPWFKGIFDAGLDVSMERVTTRALHLATGRGDVLSGRYLPLNEDLDDLVAHAPQIREGALYSLRLARLPSSMTAPTNAAFRAVRAQSEIASPTIVHLQRRLPMSAPEAFDLWRDGVTVGSWFLPSADAAWIETPTFDLRAGGAFQLRVSSAGEWYHIHGTVDDITPEAGLELDWNWESSSPVLGAGGGTKVHVRFVPSGSGADVVILHENLPNDAVRDVYIRGWRRCLDAMHRGTAHGTLTPAR